MPSMTSLEDPDLLAELPPSRSARHRFRRRFAGVGIWFYAIFMLSAPIAAWVVFSRWSELGETAELLGMVVAVVLGTPVGIYSSIFGWDRINKRLAQSLRDEVDAFKRMAELGATSFDGTPVGVPLAVDSEQPVETS